MPKRLKTLYIKVSDDDLIQIKENKRKQNKSNNS